MKLTPLQADTHRFYGRSGTGLVLRGFLTNRTFRPLITLRWCQNLSRSGAGRLLLPFCQLLHRFATHNACMDLHWATTMGPGIALTHGWGLVINRGARIGANVTLFHGVTLGRRNRIGAAGSQQTGCPVLEDEVWVGAHAVIVGGVTIGRGSRIGAGAFVTEDIPPYSVVTGNPGRIVKSQCTPDVDNPVPMATPD